MNKWTRIGAVSLLAMGMLIAPSMTSAAQAPDVRLAVGSQDVEWIVGGTAVALELTVGKPDGEVLRQTFAPGVAPRFHIGALRDGSSDGSYRWELRGAPGSQRTRSEADAGGSEGESAAALGWSASGTFGVSADSVYVGLEAEGASGENGGEAVVPEATVLTNADGVIRNSLCVGFDCPDSPSFGDSTIILTENNTRLKFDDTSSLGGFPNRDWQIFANDSASGGLNRFGVQDCGTSSGGGCSGNIPFTIEAATPSNSLYVDSTGRVGFRTSTPVLDLHVNTSNTPGLRFEQNSSGGFSPQTWDVAGNEANFFVRDVTGGSRLPFRIRPGAPTSSIDIAADGDVGIGTASPEAKVHVNGETIRIKKTGNTGDAQIGFDLVSEGGTVDASWFFRNNPSNGAFTVTDNAGGSAPFKVFPSNPQNLLVLRNNRLGIGGVVSPTENIEHASGAKLIGGNWTNASSRDFKTDIHPLEEQAALAAFAGLVPVTFEYRERPHDVQVGFIAEDVPDLVATPDHKGLSSMDLVAVLTRVVQHQQGIIDELADRLQRLETQQSGSLNK